MDDEYKQEKASKTYRVNPPYFPNDPCTGTKLAVFQTHFHKFSFPRLLRPSCRPSRYMKPPKTWRSRWPGGAILNPTKVSLVRFVERNIFSSWTIAAALAGLARTMPNKDALWS